MGDPSRGGLVRQAYGLGGPCNTDGATILRRGHSASRLLEALVCSLLVAPILSPSTPAYEESNWVDEGRTTHQALMEQMLEVLEADGNVDLASYLSQNVATLKAGTFRADWTLVDSGDHYIDPFTGEGFPGFRSAGELARLHAQDAETFWTEGDHWSALEALGRVLHLIQDLTVPHHARLTPFEFHLAYETWVTDHLSELPATPLGTYEVEGVVGGAETDPLPWILAAGRASYPKFDLVDGPDGVDNNDYAAAAHELVPLAVALSAGYAKTFFEALDSGPPTVEWAVPSEGRVGVPVEMSCLRCADDGAIARFVWSVGDQGTWTGAMVRPVFHRADPYQVTLEVVDIIGKTTSLSGTILIRDGLDTEILLDYWDWAPVGVLVMGWVTAAAAALWLRERRSRLRDAPDGQPRTEKGLDRRRE